MGYDESTRTYSGADGIVMEVESLRGIADLILGYERSGDDKTRCSLENETPERIGILLRGIADRIGNYLGEVEVEQKQPTPTQTQAGDQRKKLLNLVDAVNLRFEGLQGFMSLLATTSPEGAREVTKMQWSTVTFLGERLLDDLKKGLNELNDFRFKQAQAAAD